jgi:hypothetical protein
METSVPGFLNRFTTLLETEKIPYGQKNSIGIRTLVPRALRVVILFRLETGTKNSTGKNGCRD